MSGTPPRSPWRVVQTRRVPLALRVDRRVPLVAALLLLATFAVMILNVGTGDYPIAPLDVIKTVLRLPASEDLDFVVNTLRLPRVLVAALVGMALGISGAILQGLTRNPLAAPDVLGISSGAGLAAAALIVLGSGAWAGWIPMAAFAAGMGVAGVVYLLAWRAGDSPLRLILVGIGIGSVISALTTILLTFGEINSVQRAMVWLTGSVYGSAWEDVWALLPWVAGGGLAALLLARDLNALHLGEEVARGLGSRVELRRGWLLLTAVALASASVAAAGLVGFVALVAPHSARRLVGVDATGLLVVAALVGALVVSAADLLGRTLFAPIELPCGLITAAVGAPFFMVLLWQQRRRAV